jgi:hypothetical protein
VNLLLGRAYGHRVRDALHAPMTCRCILCITDGIHIGCGCLLCSMARLEPPPVCLSNHQTLLAERDLSVYACRWINLAAVASVAGCNAILLCVGWHILKGAYQLHVTATQTPLCVVMMR